ncbi:MAG: hypothetical protein ACP5JG_14885 [Anaerolineae bacterium]
MRTDLTEAEITPYLEKLEGVLDADHVARTRELQRRAFAFEPVDHVPTMIIYPLPSEEWPSYDFQEIFDDPGKMLLHELRDVYAGARLGDDRLYGIRANYGTGIIASMFGCRTVTFEDSLPIGLAVSDDRLDRILDGGVPPLRGGPHSSLIERALDTVAYYREMLAPCPKLSSLVGSQMLDIQGPFDNATIIWGSDLYYAFYDAPDKLHRLMEIIADTILAVVEEHRRVDGSSPYEHGGQWNYLGGLCVRNDSSVNLSAQQYTEFVQPHDQKLLEPYGGWIHYCGKADWWQALLSLRNLKGANPYQGEFYDMIPMYEAHEEAAVPIVQWTAPVDEACRERIRTGFSRVFWAEDYDEARRARDHLHATGHADGYRQDDK